MQTRHNLTVELTFITVINKSKLTATLADGTYLYTTLYHQDIYYVVFIVYVDTD